MLGRKIDFKIRYSEKEIVLNFTVRTLKNIHDLVGYSPFKFLSDFIEKKDKVIELSQLIFCMLDGEIDLFDIMNNLLVDNETITYLTNGILSLINLEMDSEIEDEVNESKGNSVNTEEVHDLNKSWVKWWNYYYYTSKVNLNMSYDEFLDTTVREIKTLDRLNNDNRKNVLLSAYIDVMNNRNGSGNKVANTNIATKDNNIRIRDLLGRK